MGTPEYAAPEAARGVGHDATVDYWGLGVLAHDLLAGETPFSAETPLLVYYRILRAPSHPPLDHLRHSRTWGNLCKRLLEPDPALRLGALSDGARDVRRHFAFSEIDWPALVSGNVAPPAVPGGSVDKSPSPRRRSVFAGFGKP